MSAVDIGTFGAAGVPGPRLAIEAPDARASMAGVLAALAREVRLASGGGSLRATFESALRDTFGARLVRLREGPASCVGVTGGPVRRISVPVPVPDHSSPVVLEAILDAGASFGGLDSYTLGLAAHVAALVLEVERARIAAARPPSLARRADPVAPPLVGTSAAMTTLRDNIARVAETDFIVLIEGESGTGKELVARQLHQLSHRRLGPFVAVNCAAIVESLLEAELFGIEDRTATGVRGRRGKFEHADGGTLFLDEVSDLAPAAQAKLLRAIQELSVERVGGHATRKVNTRIVVATNKSLRDLAASGQFRQDLYYRLSGVELHVPPLRARRQDIPDLCGFFLSRYRSPRPLELGAEAVQAMQLYDWPGNVRELERMIEGAVALAADGKIAMADLPAAIRSEAVGALHDSLGRDDTMRAWGARYARLVLQGCAGNKRKACRRLDISYHTLMAYLRWRPLHQSGEAPAWPVSPVCGSPPEREASGGVVEQPAGV